MSITPAEEAQILTKGSGLTPISTAAGIPPIAAQAFDRRFALSTAWAPSTGVLTLTSIWLPAGQIVNAITFMSGATAESGGQHLWFAIYRSDNGALMAQAADNTAAAAFGASLSFRMALQSAVTCPYTGLYWLAFMCAQSAGAVPTLLNVTSGVTTNNGAVASTAPPLAFTADSSLTTTAPATLGAKTVIVQALWAGID